MSREISVWVGLEDHLERALEEAENPETRYHLREALQRVLITDQ